MTGPPIPMSGEVAAHHVGQHPCDDYLTPVVCPCGNAVVWACVECGEALMICTRPGTWCAHAREVWEACGRPLA